MTVSYFEWVQDLGRLFWDRREIRAKLAEQLGDAFERVWTLSEEKGLSLRSAALVAGIREVAGALELAGDLSVSRVRDAMIPDPAALDASATAQEAGEHLVQPDVRAVYVSDGERFVGVVTRKTLVEKVVAAGRDPRSTPVGELAEPPNWTIDPELPLDEAFGLLEEWDAERVPVVDGGRLVGVLSRSVLQRRLAEDEPPAELEGSAAGVGAGRRVALDGLGQLAPPRAPRRASRSRSLTSRPVEPVAVEHGRRRSRRRRRSPARARARGREARGARRAGGRRAARAAARRPRATGGSRGRARVVAAELERGERRDRAGDADRARSARAAAAARAPRARPRPSSPARAGPSAGGARSAAPSRRRCWCARLVVISSVEPPPTSSTSVPSSSGRPVATPRSVSSASSSPRDEPRGEAVAPLDLAEEGLAVLGVADGARPDREHALGAEPLELAAVVGEHVPHPRDRQRQQLAALVDALAEPRDLALPRDLLDAPVVDVRDQQTGRVGAQVDGCDAHRTKASGAL